MCVFVISYVDCCCFFKQKTAYELRISDWSSDVCSSDLSASRTVFITKTDDDAVDHALEAIECISQTQDNELTQTRSETKTLGTDEKLHDDFLRSEERREGTECVGTWRTRGGASH